MELTKTNKEEVQARPAIQTSMSELKKHGITDVVMITELWRFGLDTEITNLMVKYDIFPQVFLIRKDFYVATSHIRKVVHDLLLTNMRLYQARETMEEGKANAIKYIEDNKIRITPEDVTALENGAVTLVEVVEKRKAEADALALESEQTTLSLEPQEADIGTDETATL